MSKHLVFTDVWKGKGQVLKVETPQLKYVPNSAYQAWKTAANWTNHELIAEYNSFADMLILINLFGCNLTMANTNLEGTAPGWREFIDRNPQL